jgi:hypothetical protein
MPGFAKPLNTSEMSGRDSLWGLYKDFLTCNGTLRFQAAVVITLRNDEDALTRIISTPQEDRAIPHQRTPLLPFRQDHYKLKFLIN